MNDIRKITELKLVELKHYAYRQILHKYDDVQKK